MEVSGVLVCACSLAVGSGVFVTSPPMSVTPDVGEPPGKVMSPGAPLLLSFLLTVISQADNAAANMPAAKTSVTNFFAVDFMSLPAFPFFAPSAYRRQDAAPTG